MKKVTIARIITTGLSTAGAILCPQLLDNKVADTAIKSVTATLLACIPDITVAATEKVQAVRKGDTVVLTPAPGVVAEIHKAELHEVHAADATVKKV